METFIISVRTTLSTIFSEHPTRCPFFAQNTCFRFDLPMTRKGAFRLVINNFHFIQDLEHTLFFRDRKRRIDLVLVYDDEDFSKGVLNEHEYLRIEHRQRFQKSLEEEGLELEIELKEVISTLTMR